jgi:hypothetical protein
MDDRLEQFSLKTKPLSIIASGFGTKSPTDSENQEESAL